MENNSKSSLMFLDNSSSEEDNNNCLLCKQNIDSKNFPNIIIKALSRKYCSNLNNYYFTKNINRVLENERIPDVIYYKEWNNEIDQEFFKRQYLIKEYKPKFNRLLSHYIDDIPRPSIFTQDFFKIHMKFYYIKEKIKRKEEIYDFEDDTESSDDSSENIEIKSLLLKDLNNSNKENQLKRNKFDNKVKSISKIIKNNNPDISIANKKEFKKIDKYLNKILLPNNLVKKNHIIDDTKIKRNFLKKKNKNYISKDKKNKFNKKKNEIKLQTLNLNKILPKNNIFNTHNSNIYKSQVPTKNIIKHKTNRVIHKKNYSNHNLIKNKPKKSQKNRKPNKFSISLEKSNMNQNCKFFKKSKDNNKKKIHKKTVSSISKFKLTEYNNLKNKIIPKNKNYLSRTKNIFNLNIDNIDNKNILNIKNLLNLKLNKNDFKKLLDKKLLTHRYKNNNKKLSIGNNLIMKTSRNKFKKNDFCNFSDSKNLNKKIQKKINTRKISDYNTKTNKF